MAQAGITQTGSRGGFTRLILTLVLLLGLMTVGLVAALIAVTYMLPTVIAYIRKFENKKTYAIINALLGWTGIIWLMLAFGVLWSLTAQQTVNVYTTDNAGKTKKQNIKG